MASGPMDGGATNARFLRITRTIAVLHLLTALGVLALTVKSVTGFLASVAEAEAAGGGSLSHVRVMVALSAVSLLVPVGFLLWLARWAWRLGGRPARRHARSLAIAQVLIGAMVAATGLLGWAIPGGFEDPGSWLMLLLGATELALGILLLRTPPWEPGAPSRP